MITCYHINLTYPASAQVLKDVTFKLRPGGFHFLTGASGAGKTSLLNILSLHQRPTGGRLIMYGKEVLSLQRDILPMVRRRIGCVYQNYQLLDHLTVAENIALPQKISGKNKEDYMPKIEELLHWIHMEQYKDALPPTLSGGEKQRVAIARAVINNPSIILADEPTGNLDPDLSKKVMHLFESLHQLGTTVLIATHDKSLIKEFNYPVFHLEDGIVKEKPRDSL
jgi:cell division transport system ATP-binding protein